jgi:hypothetical protein
MFTMFPQEQYQNNIADLSTQICVCVWKKRMISIMTVIRFLRVCAYALPQTWRSRRTAARGTSRRNSPTMRAGAMDTARRRLIPMRTRTIVMGIAAMILRRTKRQRTPVIIPTMLMLMTQRRRQRRRQRQRQGRRCASRAFAATRFECVQALSSRPPA